MLSAFFIRRPRFALVISIVLLLAGGVAIFALPIAQYPDIVPPQVVVSASYGGASADVIEATVAAPLEAQVNGVEGMAYMSSTSSDGAYSLAVTFDLGVDPDLAAVNVQNRVSLATASLPTEVIQSGVSVRKRSSSMLQVMALTSPSGAYDNLFLSNYASIQILDEISRIDGVGSAAIFGSLDYSMRIWLDPARMAGLGVAVTDVTAAILDQNTQAAAGQVGQAPARSDQAFQYTVRTKGRLSDVGEFEEIIVRSSSDGAQVRLGDIARISLGSQSYSAFAKLNGKDAIAFAVYQLPEANALEVATAVQATMARLASQFPAGVEYQIVHDATTFIEVSLEELVDTLMIALLLVLLVVYVFLQDWRATIVPTVAIPVSLIGTFAGMLALGFSINTITLFGLVLAIGVVVDDAILVIENVQRHIAQGLSPREATLTAMREVTGPIIATTLVLLAVFVPVSLLGGVTGELFRQFSVTIAIAVTISSVNALTLSPALCAMLLRAPRRPWLLLRWFNSLLETCTAGYVSGSKWLIRFGVATALLFAVLCAGTGWLSTALPTGFLPDEDQGVLFVNAQLPDGASLARTDKIMARMEQEVMAMPGVHDVMALRGISMLAGASSNVGMMVLSLEPWAERTAPELSASSIAERIMGQLGAIPGVTVLAFAPSAIAGLGSSSGLEYQLQDTGSRTPQELASVARGLSFEATQDPKLQMAFSTFRADVPQVSLDLDRSYAKALGVPIQDVFTTLQAFLGGLYVNDFNRSGRVYRVQIQAEQEARDDASDIGQLHVRSSGGDMVPLSSVTRTSSTLGAQSLTRFNMYRSAAVTGLLAPGVSTGDGIAFMEELSRETLPDGMTWSWSGLSYQEQQAGSQILWVLALALLFAYLFLVAQYESWSIPIAVVLGLPIALAGAFVAVWVAGAAFDLYVQIALILLVGLASKQAIVIVEFAKNLREAGATVVEAALQACQLRFRAVMMTAFSFIFGVLPLVLASGAGAAARVSLGAAIFGGMIVAAVLGTLMTPRSTS